MPQHLIDAVLPLLPRQMQAVTPLSGTMALPAADRQRRELDLHGEQVQIRGAIITKKYWQFVGPDDVHP